MAAERRGEEEEKDWSRCKSEGRLLEMDGERRIGKSASGDGSEREERIAIASHSFRETGTTKDEIYVARLRDNRGRAEPRLNRCSPLIGRETFPVRARLGTINDASRTGPKVLLLRNCRSPLSERKIFLMRPG